VGMIWGPHDVRTWRFWRRRRFDTRKTLGETSLSRSWWVCVMWCKSLILGLAVVCF